MFYVKEKINENVEIRIDIECDNVYNICPGCGCETKVDIAEVFEDKEGDLYGTAIYCEECSKKMI